MKPAEHFHRATATKDGRLSGCIACLRIQRLAYEAANGERLATARATAKRARYAGDPDYARKHAEYARRWFAANTERAKEIQAKARKNWRASGKGKFDGRIRWAVRSSLVGRKKMRPTYEALGYTLDELKRHLERQFSNGMNWENMSDWHVDHIVPLKAFSIVGTECPDFRRAWALPNLRPLWAVDNIRKSATRTHLI